MELNYLVFDIETTGLNPLTDRITTIGYCIDGNTTSIYEEQEEQTIKLFLDVLDKCSHEFCLKLSGYNINAFDIRFLFLRAIKYGLLKPESYFYKVFIGAFNNFNNPLTLDLMDFFTFKKFTQQRVHLQEALIFLGLPLKTGTGEQAIDLFKEGKILELQRYVENDAKVEWELLNFFRKNKLIK